LNFDEQIKVVIHLHISNVNRKYALMIVVEEVSDELGIEKAVY
jgi:hypothetical protein